MSRQTSVVGWLVLLVVGTTLACHAPPTSQHALVQQSLARGRALWDKRAQEMAGYDLTVSIGCFCPLAGEHVLHVRGGSLIGAESRRNAPPIDEQVLRSLEPYTVDGLFQQVEQAIESHAEIVEAIFDHSYGYPIAVKVDSSTTISDDELEVTARLTAIPIDGTR